MTSRNDGDRRHFILMSCAAAGSVLAAGAVAADPIAQSDTGNAAGSMPVYLVIFRPGPAWESGTPIKDLPLRDHGRYMLELFKRGSLRYAGPFADDSGAAVVLAAEDDVAARALVEADPAVTAQLFSFQLHRWSTVPWSEIAKR